MFVVLLCTIDCKGRSDISWPPRVDGHVTTAAMGGRVALYCVASRRVTRRSRIRSQRIGLGAQFGHQAADSDQIMFAHLFASVLIAYPGSDNFMSFISFSCACGKSTFV